MTTAETITDISLLRANARVPQSVVYRSFPSETVVLNLDTGEYHGLNATAGQMLQALVDAPSVATAIQVLAAAYRQPRAVVETDVRKLCGALLERGLIEIDEPSSAP